MLTRNSLTLGFERKDRQPFDFSPGQFITLLIDTEEGLKRRSYSVATIPNHKHLIELVLTLQEGGVASRLLAELAPGEMVKALGPVGRLVMHDDEAKRYVLIGTSTGIAPYRSMLPQLSKRLQAQEDFSVVMVEGVQYCTDLLYEEDFLAFADDHPKFTFYAKLSRDTLDNAQAHQSSGYVQESFADLQLNPEEDVVYLCGNPNMIDDAFKRLTEQGFAVKSVRREKYISSN